MKIIFDDKEFSSSARLCFWIRIFNAVNYDDAFIEY